MTELQYSLPEDFEPVLTKEETQERDVVMFVRSGDNFKDYMDATPEEILAEAKALCGSTSTKDAKKLTLLQNRTIELDRAISIAIVKSTKVFGGPEFWESQPDWERPSKIISKGKEKE